MEILHAQKADRVCTPEYVCYAAYGSNMLRSRFLCYIKGLAPTENHKAHAGCRNPADPLLDRPALCTHPVVYAGTSSSWGVGGVAFLDWESNGARSPIRLWRVTRDQFEDICAMENGLEPGAIAIDFASLVQAGTKVAAPRIYGRAVYLGDVDGDPVVTFTWRERLVELSPPSERYAATIAAGLAEMGSAAG